MCVGVRACTRGLALNSDFRVTTYTFSASVCACVSVCLCVCVRASLCVEYSRAGRP